MKGTKDILLILGIMLILVLFSNSKVYAVDPQVQIIGDAEIKEGEKKTVTIKVSSTEDKIATIEGVISFSDNIENIVMNPNDPDEDQGISNYNGWTMSYNESTGEMKAFKASGTQEGAICEISYNIKKGSTSNATITITNLSLITTNYETRKISTPVTKKITLKSDTPEPTPDPQESKVLKSISITKEPTKTSYKEGEKFNKNGMEVTAKYSDGTSKKITKYTYSPTRTLNLSDKYITIKYTENNVTKTVRQDISVTKVNEKDDDSDVKKGDDSSKKDDNVEKKKTSTSKKDLPRTGIATGIIILIILFIVIGTISYKKYKNLKKL